MNKLLAGMGASSGAAAGTAVVVVAVLAGVAWTQLRNQGGEDATPVVAAPLAAEAPTEQAEAPTAETPAVQAEAPSVEAPTPQVQTSPEPETVAEPTQQAAAVPAPAFDEVRREADGMTVIAGRAAPGAEVMILQNGTEIARVTADGTGKFATLTMIPPDGKGHVLSLLQTADTQVLASLDEIILAPLDAPVVVVQVAVPDATEETAPAVDETAPAVAVAEREAPLAETETAVVETIPAPAPPAPVVAEIETPLAETETAEVPAVTADQTLAATAALPVEVQPGVSTAMDGQVAPTAPVVASEPAPVAVLKSTAEGVELLNPNAPEVMDNVALDTISYSLAGDVQLSGRAQSDARAVRVYLDNDAVISLEVAADGSWRGDLPNVDEGIYTLRVDEVAADGSVSSRVETPFKREAPEVLAAASAAQDGPIKAITVQKGATLWAIARERYGRGELYVRVFEANKNSIRDANLIYPGQIFDLPD